ncbi:MAG: NTP transferase domain-containing protein [Bacteroidetes bacterium]|nr:NTP transferase domain-containing protein [Bacteroidota bacterium]
MKKVDIYITVRLKSKRLPRKAVVEVAGQTILEHIIDRAKQIKHAKNIVVCTSTNEEDTPLLEYAQKKGVPFFRGSENNVVARFLGAAELFKPDICVRITGDNCLFSPEFIDYGIEQHIKNGVDYTTTKQMAGGGKGDIFSYDALVRLNKLMQDENASEYLSWLFADDKHFKVQWLDVEESLKRPQYRLHCDTPDDLKFIKEVYANLYDGKSIVDYKRMIAFLDAHPEIVEINKNIIQVSKDQVKNTINLELK